MAACMDELRVGTKDRPHWRASWWNGPRETPASFNTMSSVSFSYNLRRTLARSFFCGCVGSSGLLQLPFFGLEVTVLLVSLPVVVVT